MSDTRRYDEREVALILRRIAELHEGEAERVDGRSLTASEIEDVVSELGLPKALVTRAMSDLAVSGVRNRSSWWLGGKTDVLLERRYHGQVDDGHIDAMLEPLRRSLGDPGELRREGAVVIWSTTRATTRRIHFTLSPLADGGAVMLRLEEQMPADANSTVIVSALMGFFAASVSLIPLKALLGKPMLMLAILPLWFLGVASGWWTGRAVWKRTSRERERELRAAFDAAVQALTHPTAGARELPEPADDDA